MDVLYLVLQEQKHTRSLRMNPKQPLTLSRLWIRFLTLKKQQYKKKDKDKHSTKLYRVVDGFNLTYLTGSLYVNVLRLPGTYCFDTH